MGIIPQHQKLFYQSSVAQPTRREKKNDPLLIISTKTEINLIIKAD